LYWYTFAVRSSWLEQVPSSVLGAAGRLTGKLVRGGSAATDMGWCWAWRRKSTRVHLETRTAGARAWSRRSPERVACGRLLLLPLPPQENAFYSLDDSSNYLCRENGHGLSVLFVLGASLPAPATCKLADIGHKKRVCSPKLRCVEKTANETVFFLRQAFSREIKRAQQKFNPIEFAAMLRW
jgi:hypothetical protein